MEHIETKLRSRNAYHHVLDRLSCNIPYRFHMYMTKTICETLLMITYYMA